MGHILQGKDIRILRVVGNGHRWREYYDIQGLLTQGGSESLDIPSVESVTTLIFDEEVLEKQVRSMSSGSTMLLKIRSNAIYQYRLLLNWMYYLPPSSFPNVRSLSITLYNGWSFAEDIGAGCPLLIALRIIGPKLDVFANQSLSQLEILELEFEGELRDCQFPSLKHVSLRGAEKESHTAFLRSHSHGVESLLLPRWTHVYFLEDQDERNFWSEFPSLQLLGISSTTTAQMKTPPSNHPLKHIFLCDDQYYHFETMNKAIDRMPGLQYLSIDSYGVGRSQLNAVKQLCEEKKVNLLFIPYRKRFAERLAQGVAGKVPSWQDLTNMYDVVRRRFYNYSS
jgi:hypothetical protein